MRRLLPPSIALLLTLLIWEAAVRLGNVPAYLLPAKILGVTPTAPPQPHPVHRTPQSPARIRQPKTCLIVHHGNYPPGTITGASPPAIAGHYALMVLRVRHPSVERIFVTDQLHGT